MISYCMVPMALGGNPEHNINTDPSGSRTIDPDMALGSILVRAGQHILVLGRSTDHSGRVGS